MKLSQDAQQSLDFSKTCLLQGYCTPKEYLKAVKSIYQEETARQVKVLVEEAGFTEDGAIRHIYNLDEGENIL